MFSLDLMRTLDATLVFAAALLFASCAYETGTRSSPAHARIEGNVGSVSSADIGRVLDLEREAMAKELGSVPPTVIIRVIDRDHIEFEYWFHGWQYGDGVERVKGKWKLFTGPRATIEAGAPNI